MKILCRILIVLLPVLSYAQTANRNYLVTRDFKQLGAGVNDVSSVNVTVQYFDSLGRKTQHIAVGNSTIGTDVVSVYRYDVEGRLKWEYLPYALKATDAGNGTYRGSAIAEQATFYSNNTAELQGPSTDLARPFLETNFESSTMNRVTGQQAAGAKSKPTFVSYGWNSASEVKRYVYAPNADITLTISSPGNFSEKMLYKKQSTDDNGKVVIEFSDMQDRLICKRALNGSEELSTYFVYDDYGLLRAVLQPEYQVDSNAANSAFLFSYDGYGRQIVKKAPGSGKVEMVYDNFDRLAMSQDANQAAKATKVWTFNKYDALNRKIMSGEVASSSNRVTLQTNFNASSGHHETLTANTIGYTLTGTLPSVVAGNVFNVTYFDGYTFPSSQAYEDRFSVTNNSNVKGKQTGWATRMQNTAATLLVATTHYDAEYRVIQQIRQMPDLGSLTIERVSTKFKYNLAPVVQQELTAHEANNTAVNSHLKTFTYDHVDRLLSIRERLTLGNKSKEAVTVAHRYNILGQLKRKFLHSDNGTDFRRKTVYTNNIRGWITDGETFYKRNQQDDSDSSFFAYQLSYMNGEFYTNGNVSKMEWRRKTEANFTAGLSFSYDGVNRLTSAFDPTETNEYTYGDVETVTYYPNGNIKTLVRGGAAVDNLIYNYTGNQLTSISDGSGSNTGVKSGTSTFTYDANGNMQTDGNRGITSMSYNFLNLPQTIVVGGNTITYDYDASGAKHKYSSTATTIKYEGPFQYNNSNGFERLALAEGQAVYREDTLHFDYYLKDHLGNVRVVFDEKGKILQKTDYFAFGLEIDRNTPVQTPAVRNGINRYMFLGREKQPEAGYTDLKRRFYDPAIGRFMQVDPMTESQEQLSVYQYGWNNPIRYSDPDGDCPICDDFKKLYNATKNYLTKNVSGYVKTSVEVTGGQRVALKIGEGVGGDMNAASVRLVKGEASYDTKEKGKASLDYVTKPDEKGRNTMTVSHGVDYAAGVGGGAKMEYQLNSSGQASGEGSSEVQIAATLPVPTFAIYGKYETDKLTGQSSVQVGINSSYKAGAGVVIDANFFDFGIKFRIPQSKEP